MVTAQQHRPYATRTATAVARPAHKPAPLHRPDSTPRLRPLPRSRRREYQGWIILMILASLLLLTIGVMSLYGSIRLAQEGVRRASLASQLKQEQHRGEELMQQKAQRQADTVIAAEAAKRHMIRPTDDQAVTVP